MSATVAVMLLPLDVLRIETFLPQRPEFICEALTAMM